MKYNNRRFTAEGIKWDSQAEHDRYQELKLLEKAGEIKNLQYHGKELEYVLISKQRYKNLNGKIISVRETKYIPDFRYYIKDLLIAEDVKGMITESFKIKEKLFRERFPHIYLRIVKFKKTKRGYEFYDK